MKNSLLAFVVLTLGACTTVPPTNVHQPMTVRPEPRPVAQVANGAIFQAGGSRPLFEDRRARFMGDTITVRIKENPSATKNASNNLSRSGSQSASVKAFTGMPVSGLDGLSMDMSSKTESKGSGQAASRATFTGDLTVTVIDVLPNGNLLVSGEKQIAIGKEQEFIRISGVVNPSFVDFTNTVDSSKIADARIEYKSSGQIAEGQVMGWLARFFLSVMPF
jgi:flagellar L-ring protein precursor FlgH